MNTAFNHLEWFDVHNRLPSFLNHTFYRSWSEKVVVFDGKNYQTACYTWHHENNTYGFYHDGIEVIGVLRWAWEKKQARYLPKPIAKTYTTKEGKRNMILWQSMQDTPPIGVQLYTAVKQRFLGNCTAIGVFDGSSWSCSLDGTITHWARIEPPTKENKNGWFDAQKYKPDICQRVGLIVTDGKKEQYAIGGIDTQKRFFNDKNDTFKVLYWSYLPLCP